MKPIQLVSSITVPLCALVLASSAMAAGPLPLQRRNDQRPGESIAKRAQNEIEEVRINVPTLSSGRYRGEAEPSTSSQAAFNQEAFERKWALSWAQLAQIEKDLTKIKNGLPSGIAASNEAKRTALADYFQKYLGKRIFQIHDEHWDEKFGKGFDEMNLQEREVYEAGIDKEVDALKKLRIDPLVQTWLKVFNDPDFVRNTIDTTIIPNQLARVRDELSEEPTAVEQVKEYLRKAWGYLPTPSGRGFRL